MWYDLLKIVVSVIFNMLNFLLAGKLPPFGSASVVVEENNRYLVVELPRGRVVFPGGFMTWREDPRQAAEREGKEETGFALQADDLIGFYTLPSSSWTSMSNISFVFRAHITGGALHKNIEGHPCWMSEEELHQRLRGHALHVFEDYLQYRQRRQAPGHMSETVPSSLWMNAQQAADDKEY